MRTVLAAAGALLATLVLLEAGIAGLVKAGWLDLPAPGYGPALLWDGEDPRFGHSEVIAGHDNNLSPP